MLNLLCLVTSAIIPWRRDLIRSGVYLRRAQRAEARGDHAQADTLFERALSLGVTDSRLYIQYGWALLERGDSARAIEMLDNAREVDPGNTPAMIFLALAYSDAGCYEDAEEQAEAACTAAPANRLAASVLALNSIRRHKNAEAAIRLQDRLADNLHVRSRLLVEVEKILNVPDRHLLEEVLPKPHDEAETFAVAADWSGRRCSKLGAKAFSKGRYKSARKLLEAAIARGADSLDVRLYLAGIYMFEEDYAAAARVLEPELAKPGSKGAALFYSGMCHCLTGDYAAASPILEAAAADESAWDFEEYLGYYQGLCLLAQGKEAEARQAFEQALDADWKLLPRRLNLIKKEATA